MEFILKNENYNLEFSKCFLLLEKLLSSRFNNIQCFLLYRIVVKGRKSKNQSLISKLIGDQKVQEFRYKYYNKNVHYSRKRVYTNYIGAHYFQNVKNNIFYVPQESCLQFKEHIGKIMWYMINFLLLSINFLKK